MTLARQFRTATGIMADPYGLTRMLMDGALERIEAARDQDLQDRADGVPAGHLLESATMIIDKLRTGLDLRHGGVFAANVDDLYDYMCRRLHAAAPDEADRTVALHEVSHLLEALRCAWTFMPTEVRIASGN